MAMLGVRVTGPRSVVPSRTSLSVSILPRANIVRDLVWNEGGSTSVR